MIEPEPPPPKAVELEVNAIAESPPGHADPDADALATGERASLDNELLKSELKDKVQDRTERLKYATASFRLVRGWLIVVGLVVFAQGFHSRGFDLSGPVMIALLGSTTASVLGIFYIVANYLFPGGAARKP